VRHVLIVSADAGHREVIKRGLELRLGPGWPSTQSAIVMAIDTCEDREPALSLLRKRAELPGEPYEVLILEAEPFDRIELRHIVGVARSLFPRMRVALLGTQAEDTLLDLANDVGAHRALPRWTITMLASVVGFWLRPHAPPPSSQGRPPR